MSEVCAALVQGQVEGDVPKAYEDLYILGVMPDRERLEAWWAPRAGRTLEELQIEAARHSLAEAKKAAYLSAEEKAAVVKIFSERLRDLGAGP